MADSAFLDCETHFLRSIRRLAVVALAGEGDRVVDGHAGLEERLTRHRLWSAVAQELREIKGEEAS